MRKHALRILAFVQSQKRLNDEGAVSAEYGVLLAGIVAIVALAAAALGGRIGDIFDSVLP